VINQIVCGLECDAGEVLEFPSFQSTLVSEDRVNMVLSFRR
jgi:hypothetical protein